MVQITFHGLPHSDAIAEAIERHAERLQRLAPTISRVRAVVESPHLRHRQGNHFRVLLDVSVRGRDVVVGRERANDLAAEDPYTAIARVFDIAARKIAERPRRTGRQRAHGYARPL
jgi:ribosome-associated translation inhibitor RaiA